MKIGEYFQQGDLILTRVSDTDLVHNNATKVTTDKAILQRGDATGHAHRIDGKGFNQYQGWRDRFLELTKTVTLKHEEHKPITLPPGIYRIGIVREVDHFAKETRYVRD